MCDKIWLVLCRELKRLLVNVYVTSHWSSSNVINVTGSSVTYRSKLLIRQVYLSLVNFIGSFWFDWKVELPLRWCGLGAGSSNVFPHFRCADVDVYFIPIVNRAFWFHILLLRFLLSSFCFFFILELWRRICFWVLFLDETFMLTRDRTRPKGWWVVSPNQIDFIFSGERLDSDLLRAVIFSSQSIGPNLGFFFPPLC